MLLRHNQYYFLGNGGGYLGLFLGYTLKELPNFIKSMIKKAKKVFCYLNKKRRQDNCTLEESEQEQIEQGSMSTSISIDEDLNETWETPELK